MNDSILTFRQNKIVKILQENGGLSRPQIALLMGENRQVSKPTLVRDLKGLLESGLISQRGRARATQYFIPKTNILLRYIDIEVYFDLELSEREAKTVFDWEIFKKIRNLFSEEELEKWQASAREFDRRVKALDRSIFQRELERFIVEFAWKSSQIEGNTYDLLETETLLTQNIEAKGHTRQEAIMLLNHKRAIKAILANKNSFKKISYADVLQLHGVLVKGLVTSGIRNQPVGISGTNYRPMADKHDLEKALKNLVRLINTIINPAEKAFVASFMIAYIQPFVDGNKRTARTLANAILIAHDYFPLSYRDIDLNEYRKAVILFDEQNNLFYLKKIFVKQLEFAVNNYFRT